VLEFLTYVFVPLGISIILLNYTLKYSHSMPIQYAYTRIHNIEYSDTDLIVVKKHMHRKANPPVYFAVTTRTYYSSSSRGLTSTHYRYDSPQSAARHGDDSAIPLLLEGPDTFSADSNSISIMSSCAMHEVICVFYYRSRRAPMSCTTSLLVYRFLPVTPDFLLAIVNSSRFTTAEHGRLAIGGFCFTHDSLAVTQKPERKKNLRWLSSAPHRHCMPKVTVQHTLVLHRMCVRREQSVVPDWSGGPDIPTCRCYSCQTAFEFSQSQASPR
jgi:hypothetical protein